MKLIFILLFSINLLHAQQLYEFDKEIIYNYKFNEEIYESIVYINTNDYTYYLKTYKNSDYLYAIIYDLKNYKKIHFKMFEILNSKKYDLVYDKTEENYPQKLMNYNRYEYVMSRNEKTEEIKIYTNKKKKKIYKKLEFEITESETDYFLAFKFSCLHPFEFNRDLKYEKSILVTKSKINYKKRVSECNFKSANDVSLKIKSQ